MIAPRAIALKELQQIPGVGPSLAQDLVDLGIQNIQALGQRNAEQLYEQLCTLRGKHQDRCVLYVFRCAVYFATEKKHDPNLLKWWNWKDPKATPHSPTRARLKKVSHSLEQK